VQKKNSSKGKCNKKNSSKGKFIKKNSSKGKCNKKNSSKGKCNKNNSSKGKCNKNNSSKGKRNKKNSSKGVSAIKRIVSSIVALWVSPGLSTFSWVFFRVEYGVCGGPRLPYTILKKYFWKSLKPRTGPTCVWGPCRRVDWYSNLGFLFFWRQNGSVGVDFLTRGSSGTL
jgi:hypothetical protein